MLIYKVHAYDSVRDGIVKIKISVSRALEMKGNEGKSRAEGERERERFSKRRRTVVSRSFEAPRREHFRR